MKNPLFHHYEMNKPAFPSTGMAAQVFKTAICVGDLARVQSCLLELQNSMQGLFPFSPFEDLLSQGPKPWTVDMLGMFLRKDKTPRALCDDDLTFIFGWKDNDARDAVLELYVREGLRPNNHTLGLAMQAHVPFGLLEGMLRSGFDTKHDPRPNEPKFALKYYQYRLITDHHESVLCREIFLFAVASFCKYPYQKELHAFFDILKVQYRACKEVELREYQVFSAEDRLKVCGPAPNVLDRQPSMKVHIDFEEATPEANEDRAQVGGVVAIRPPIKARVDFRTENMTPTQLMAEQERYTSVVIPDLRFALHEQETKYLQRTIEAFDFSDFTFELGICMFWRQELANAEATVLDLKQKSLEEPRGRKRKASQDL
jgi:hypothetical protein